jgi:hypothetical protein
MYGKQIRLIDLEFFYDSEFSAPGSWILTDFFSRGDERFFVYLFEDFWYFCFSGEFIRDIMSIFLKNLFYSAIFEGMKGDNFDSGTTL